MQSAAAKTPATNKQEASAVKKSSGKKLVQARLPFKIIASGSTTTAGVSGVAKEADTPVKEGRKRRLSFEAEEKSQPGKDDSDDLRGRSASKENLASTKKKKTTGGDDDVILLDDEDILEDDEDDKEEEQIEDKKVVKNHNKKLSTPSAIAGKRKCTKETSAVKSPHTPKTIAVKGKGAETPNSVNAKKYNTPASAKDKSNANKARGSATKVQIKLPLGSGKSNKRRKSKVQVECVDAELVISSDENESNPVKRAKVERTTEGRNEVGVKKPENGIKIDSDKGCSTTMDEGDDSETEGNSNVLVLKIAGNETDVSDSELGSSCRSLAKKSISKLSTHTEGLNDKDVEKRLRETRKRGDNIQHSNSITTPKRNDKDTSTKNEKDISVGDEKQSTEKLTSPTKEYSVVTPSSANSDNSSSVNEEPNTHVEREAFKTTGTPKIVREETNTDVKKNLTPKQIKLLEQRRKAREEKERRLEEEKKQKQREKEAKELTKKREREEREDQRRKDREEKEEQKRKEREERDDQKRKEREEKERKRLAEQETKNEEKRKRIEAKEEDLRKKEEERKRKEEADLKSKKEAEAFQKFFKAKRTSNGDGDAGQQQANQDETLAFRPFEIKGDMKLAPIRRKQLSPERRHQLDAFMATSFDTLPNANDLYLAKLKDGKITAEKWRRLSVDTKTSDDDIQIIGDDLDRAGLAIVEETHAPFEHFRAKLYKFHENRRPPYYGTWRKRTIVIKPRRPFAQDKKCFDYEVDSDLEWEEEEPGESLDGSDDEKERESEDDDYEVDNEWFVPHGHLSEEELQNEDEVLDANTREAQKAKLQVLQKEFAQEMKKKTEKIKPRLIGCIWADENGNQPALCPKIIWDTLSGRAMLCAIPPLLDDPEIPDKSELGSPTANGSEKTVEKLKPIKLTERMLKDLVRLVHGNHHSKTFLIKEFIAFLEANEESIKNGEARGPIKSIVREKIDDFAEWTITESIRATQNKKNKIKKHLCWVVSADVLHKMGLENLGLKNSWNYILQPRSLKDETTKVEVEAGGETPINETMVVTADEEKEDDVEIRQKTKKLKNKLPDHLQKDKKSKTDVEITKFTKLMPVVQKSPKTTMAPQGKTELGDKTTDSKPSTVAKPVAKIKKRVPLLMSVARGQSIPQPAKNALISEFLQKSSAEKEANSSKKQQAAPANISNEVSQVVELD